jgi:arylsulfatase A-like enzyme
MKEQLAIMACAALAGIGYSCKKQPEIKPNIVFILIDDLGWKDLGYMGSEYYETPNIDRLAGKGMIFTQAYANAANSAPTRACLLSGQYTPRHGLYTVGNSDRGESEDRRLVPVTNSEEISLGKITISEALKPAGYISAAIGKWHIGHSSCTWHTTLFTHPYRPRKRTSQNTNRNLWRTATTILFMQL